MGDDFYSPTRPPRPRRVPQHGELLFEFLVGHDRYVCDLRDHGELYGVEQFWQNGELFYSRRFDATEAETEANDVARSDDLKRKLADLVQQSDPLIKSAAKLKLAAEEIQRKAMANDAKRLKPQRKAK